MSEIASGLQVSIARARSIAQEIHIALLNLGCEWLDCESLVSQDSFPGCVAVRSEEMFAGLLLQTVNQADS